MDRIVLHLDMDAFFAAVEERDRPRLKGMPIVVGADPKEGYGRGVVSTANYAARKYGIRSALPISTAWRLSEEAAKKGLPRAVFLEPDFKKYSAASNAIMEYLRTLGKVEQASVDEAYIQLEELETLNSKFEILNKSKTQNPKNDVWEKAVEKTKAIKDYIKTTQKLTCSIGIGPNKLVAKIAAGMEKPDGLTVVRPEKIQVFLDPLSAREIPGIGPKSGEILEHLNIRTIEQLRKLPKEKLIELFGKWGSDMYAKARGIDDSPVTEEYETKSIGEQETYDTDTLESVFLTRRIKALSESVFKRLGKENFLFRTVSIIVRFSDFETKTRSRTLQKAVRDRKILETTALQLFLPFLDQRENPKKKRVRLLGVRAEKLTPDSSCHKPDN